MSARAPGSRMPRTVWPIWGTPIWLGDVLDRAAVVAGELLSAVGVLVALLGVGDLDPGRVAGPGDPGSDDGAGEAANDHRVEAVLEPADVLDLGDGADAGVAVVQARDQDEPSVLVAGGVDGCLGLGCLEHQGHDHARENDARVSGSRGRTLVSSFSVIPDLVTAGTPGVFRETSGSGLARELVVSAAGGFEPTRQ